MLKKTLIQMTVITAMAAFALGCGGETVPEDANDDGGEGEGEFEMGDEPTGEGETTEEGEPAEEGN